MISLRASRVDAKLLNSLSDTASRIPCTSYSGDAQLKETNKVIASISDSPKPPPGRVTLTLPVLNTARAAMFVCTGAGKARVVKDILEVRSPTLSNARIAYRPHPDTSDTPNPKNRIQIPSSQVRLLNPQTRSSGSSTRVLQANSKMHSGSKPPVIQSNKVRVKDKSLNL